MDPETLPQRDDSRDLLALKWSTPGSGRGDWRITAEDGRFRLNVYSHAVEVTHNGVPSNRIRWYVSTGQDSVRQRIYVGGEGPAGSVLEAQRMAEAMAMAMGELLKLIGPEIENPQPTTESEN